MHVGQNTVESPSVCVGQVMVVLMQKRKKVIEGKYLKSPKTSKKKNGAYNKQKLRITNSYK